MSGDGIDAVRMALMYTLLLSAPVLGAGLVVGLIVSLIQAVTQIQEQTLSFVPKIAAMLLVAVALMAWLMTKLADFAVDVVGGLAATQLATVAASFSGVQLSYSHSRTLIAGALLTCRATCDLQPAAWLWLGRGVTRSPCSQSSYSS